MSKVDAGLHVKTVTLSCEEHSGEAGAHEKSYSFRELTSLQQVFDIYLPETICSLAATRRFIERLGVLSGGATLYQGLEGDWYHETEPVRVMRMSVTRVRPDGEVVWDEESVREAVRREVAKLMLDLTHDHRHSEEAVFFNDWEARGTLVVAVRDEDGSETQASSREGRG